MFEKKYKLRITSFWSSGRQKYYYEIEYAYYRFFPFYHTLNEWLKIGTLSCYNPLLFKSMESAEYFASKMKSYQDILDFQKDQAEEAEKFRLEKENKRKQGIKGKQII